MRLVSLNAWGGQVWPALGDWVRDVQADILCLQEVTRAPVPSPEWLTYRDAFRELDQRADLFADICQILPDHQARFAAAARGLLEDGQGRPVASEHGIAFWLRRDLALTEMQHCFVHGQYRPDGWGPEPVPRTLQIARIQDPDTTTGVVFAHFHGLRDPIGKKDTQARKAQSRSLVTALTAFMQPNEPLILAGDFNLLPDSATFAALKAIGLTDLVTTGGHTDTRTALYDKPQRYADYLLVNPSVAVHRFDLPAKPMVSDHRALVLDFDAAHSSNIC